MRTHAEIVTLALLTAVILFLLRAREAGAETFLESQRHHARFRTAEARRLEEVVSDFHAVGAAWPPRGLYLRAFKLEGVVELWARAERGERFVPVRRFDICMASGVLGPKRFSGDLQVPEGHYEIEAFNPTSRYHLALRVSYPNADDRRFAAANGLEPGGDIMIHGNCVTIGCLPLRDAPMEALYVAAVYARSRGVARLPVDLHPCRYADETCRVALARHPEFADLWAGLSATDARFEATGQPPGAPGRM